MGLEQARSALETDLSGGNEGLGNEQKESIDSAPETNTAAETNTPPKPWDLDSFSGPIKYQGKEWSKEDLQKQFLMQSDYTRKTQALAREREEIQKYESNLRYDLESVKQNPALVEQFKKIYPEKYHSLVDLVVSNQAKQEQQSNNPNIDPAFLDRFNKSEAMLQQVLGEQREAKVNAHLAEIDVQMSTLAKKYPLADQETILTRAMSYNEKGQALTPELWDQIGKQVQTQYEKLFESHYKQKVEQQKQASAKAKDVSSGGGTPSVAPKRETMKEATERAIRELSGR